MFLKQFHGNLLKQFSFYQKKMYHAPWVRNSSVEYGLAHVFCMCCSRCKSAGFSSNPFLNGVSHLEAAGNIVMNPHNTGPIPMAIGLCTVLQSIKMCGISCQLTTIKLRSCLVIPLADRLCHL